MKDVVVSAALMDAGARLDRVGAPNLGFSYRRSGIGPADILLSATIRLGRGEPADIAARAAGNLAEKRNTQPLGARSAGCVFRNPEGASAGRLIDEAGCKGRRAGGIVVSPVHANFFVNTGGGTAADFLRLMDEVASVVREKFGTVLEPEIRVVGRA
jgi:UDP-N-acetylmuramate dehydrogenase